MNTEQTVLSILEHIEERLENIESCRDLISQLDDLHFDCEEIRGMKVALNQYHQELPELQPLD